MAKVKITFEFEQNEGIPEEIMQLFAAYTGVKSNSPDDKSSELEIAQVRLEFVEHLLGDKARRRPANGQKAVVKALKNVPWDEGLSREEFKERIGRLGDDVLSGVLGAFGRRVKGTPGFSAVKDSQYPLNAIIYTQKDGKWCYRLKPWVIEALEILYAQGQVQWLHDEKKY